MPSNYHQHTPQVIQQQGSYYQGNNHHIPPPSHYQTPNPSAAFVQQEQHSALANQQVGYASNVPTSNYNHAYGNITTPIHHPAIGKINDYDPLNEQPRNSTYSARQSSTVIYTSNQGAGKGEPINIYCMPTRFDNMSLIWLRLLIINFVFF